MATKKKPAAKKVAKKAAGGQSKKTAAKKKTATAKKQTTKSKSSSKSSGGGRRGAGALAKPVQPDEALAAVVGSKPLPRTEITKQIWNYIRENGLQDKENKRMIHADDTLRPVLDGKDQVNMFELTKLVSGHIES